MRRFAALIVIAALIPASGGAQTRVVTVAEAGLGAFAAPVPTLSSPAALLSPQTLPAASLAPTFSAPAPHALAVAIQPVAAAPLLPGSAKVVPAALSAVKPAASNPDKPGSEQARAAGTALFDGAVGLSAPAIGDRPSVPGSAPEDRRTSGLSPPSDADILAAYRQAQPKSKAVETLGSDFVAAAADAVQKYTFMGGDFLESLGSRGRTNALYRAAADLVDAHESRDREPARRFMQMLGSWSAFRDHARESVLAIQIAMMKAAGRNPPLNLPPSPIKGGEYWDMAAGMNAQSFIHRELESKTKYTFFDYSPFVVSYLKTAAELAGAKNVAVVEGDINRLSRPEKQLAVLRTKNAAYYVPGFSKKLEEMADWIAPGGQIIIQNDPGPGQRSLIIEQHGALVRRLITEGWEFY